MSQRSSAAPLVQQQMVPAAQVRVLIVDDSTFMRHVIARELTTDARITVVGAARNGREALALARDLQPDVITLDIEMPELDGLGALPRLLEACQARIIMLSSNEGMGRANTVRALELGAVDFILKPSGSISPNLASIRETLLRAVHNAAIATVRRLDLLAPAITDHTTPSSTLRTAAQRLVVIGSSTGGPQALTLVIPHLPADLDAGIVVVQHMPAGFTASLATRLNDLSLVAVREAASGDVVNNGEVLIAPGDQHLRFVNEGGVMRIRLDQGPRVHGVRPAVDVALTSAAELAPGCAFAAILTGMGRDGTAGAAALRATGGWVLAQDEASCVIYGMPRSVIEAGFATSVVPLAEIARDIVARLESSQLRKRS